MKQEPPSFSYGEVQVRKVNDTKIHNNIFYYSIGGSKTGHPAVFPLQLAIDQVVTWSNQDDTVLDPFMGSGTVALAALQHNFEYIGFEKFKIYVDMTNERINKFTENLPSIV